jgi:FkbM family methyltransferase
MSRRGLRIESDLAVDDVGWMLYSYGCLDYFDESAIRRMLRPGSTCLDIGAHIGYYSLLMSKWVGPNGRVVSYEPVPYTHSFLTRNLERNGATNVQPQHAAVGSHQGTVRMSAAAGQRLGWSSVSDAGDLEVRCTTIDSEAARLNLEHLDFIKMDVEGYELQALSGAELTIQRFRPKIMFEVNSRALHQHGMSPAALQEFFWSRNYELFRASPDKFSAVHDITTGPTFFNVFALPAPAPSRLGVSRAWASLIAAPRRSNKEEMPMADEKEKAIENDQDSIKPAGDKKEDVSASDLDKASGGGGFDKWFAFDKSIGN